MIGNAHLLDFFQNIFAEAVRVGEFGAGLVDPLIHGAAEMLDERAEHLAVQRRNLLRGIDIHTRRGCSGLGRRCCDSAEPAVRSHCGGCKSRLLQKCPSRGGHGFLLCWVRADSNKCKPLINTDFTNHYIRVIRVNSWLIFLCDMITRRNGGESDGNDD